MLNQKRANATALNFPGCREFLSEFFFCETPKTADSAQNARNLLFRQATVQGIEGISRQASEEFGIAHYFAMKATKVAGKQQRMPELTG